MNWYYHNRIGIDIIMFWKSIFSFVPSFIVPSIVGVFCMNFIQYDSLLKLGVAIVVYTVSYCLSVMFLGLNKEEKLMITGPLSKLNIIRRK